MTIRVLLADDHPVVRMGLRSLIDATHDLRVVQELSRGDEVLAMLGDVDVAVLDISLPGMSGLELLRAWPASGPPVTLLTMHHDYVRTALDLGARGYLVKEDATSEIVACLRAILEGRTYLSSTLKCDGSDESAAMLTEAERRVLDLVAQHKTSREIADALGTSVRTVQNHRANASAKLGLRGPGALLRWALAHQHEL